VKLAGGPARRHSRDTEAYELYLKGRYHWSKRTSEELHKAIEYLEQAIARDSGYALAYAGLADCYSVLCHYSVRPARELLPKAREAALRACALDDRLAEAHVSLGYLKAVADFDWRGSAKEFHRAFELDAGFWQAWDWHAMLLSAQGQFDEAILRMRKALELDPLSLVLHHHAAWVFIQARRYDQAIAVSRRAIELDPHFLFARLWLAMAYEQSHHYEEAVAEGRAALQLAPELVSSTYLAHIYAVSGAPGEARRLLGQTLAGVTGRYVDPYLLAMVHAGLGETERALEYLEEAYQDQSAWLPTWSKCDPRLDPLRSDPRFQNLLARLKLA
jgi:tetratricopeptide (TPR) repeat protein